MMVEAADIAPRTLVGMLGRVRTCDLRRPALYLLSYEPRFRCSLVLAFVGMPNRAIDNPHEESDSSRH